MSGGIISPEAKAEKLGRRVVLPEPDQLFVDIDNESALERYEYARRILIEHALVFIDEAGQIVETMAPSPSGKEHRYHVTLKMTRALTHVERIAFQAAIGSDPMRELLSLVQLEKGEPHPVVFFELPLPDAAPPVHLCECCSAPIPASAHIPHSTAELPEVTP